MQEVDTMVIVGFDWARDKHDVCIQNELGEILYAGVVAHDAAALDELAARIDALEPDRSSVNAGMEQHDGALLAWLLDCGFTVYGINPKSADRARDIYRPAGGKDDKTDAQVVADLLRCNLPRFKPLHPQSDETLNLRSLARLHMRLVAQKTAMMQRLRTILAEWCPAISHLCGDFNRAWQRHLLESWPLHEDLIGTHGNSVNAFLRQHRLPQKTRDALQAVRGVIPMHIPEGRKQALRFEIGLTLDQLAMMIERIARLDQELAESLACHPCFEVFHSLPVKGVQTLSMIASAFGDRRNDPTGWRRLAARWGVAPVTRASGKSRAVRRRKACDGHVLQALSNLAFTTAFSVSGCWARPFYDRKRGEGKDHHEAARAVALRWVKIIWRMWNDNTTYDEDYHRRKAGLNPPSEPVSA
jgi:transposase